MDVTTLRLYDNAVCLWSRHPGGESRHIKLNLRSLTARRGKSAREKEIIVWYPPAADSAFPPLSIHSFPAIMRAFHFLCGGAHSQKKTKKNLDPPLSIQNMFASPPRFHFGSSEIFILVNRLKVKVLRCWSFQESECRMWVSRSFPESKVVKVERLKTGNESLR